ncbi:DNA primase [Oribacterium parvum ACB1]|uniref:DNA primase n=1 Tax=Oribacterium parvum ACB1 TaxID=796943 RepID=G9WMQ1_9FIRM|nr:DNA primase [Oribacterium parvum]EHL11804.1 DNA primase [Oribacterium parvum ACB1]EJF13374.1 DNA primase [Oribacterium parvum ACB8]
MYYGEDIVEEVRQKTDIVDLVGQYVHLKKKGSSYFGLCPFHGEKTASFSVSPGKQIFYCFGCGKAGDSIRFLMEYENLSFVEALEELAERANITLPKEEKRDKGEEDLRYKILEINKQAALFYVKQLRSEKGKQGLAYCAKRKLSGESITHFGLGYAGKERDSLYQYCKSLGFKDQVLQESGLFSFKENGVYDKFFNRLIFPIMDLHNRVIGFGGRVMGDGEPKYLNSPETKLFEKSRNLFALNFSRKSRANYFILCEGYMDVISLHQWGFPEAVAALGTAFTEQQADLMKRFNSLIYLCFDSDGAGKKACKRAISILREKKLEGKVIRLSPYKDPDEFLKAEGKEAFEKRIEEAKNAFLWEVEEKKTEFDLHDPAGMQKYMESIAELLRTSFSDPVERENYLKAVAREQMLKAENLQHLVDKEEEKTQLSFGLRKNAGRQEKKREERWNSPLEEEFLSVLMQRNEFVDLAKKYIEEVDFQGDFAKEIYLKLLSGLSAKAILDSYQNEEEKYQKLVKLYHGDLYHMDLEKDEEKKLLSDYIRQLKLQKIEKEIKEVTDAEGLSHCFKERDKWEHFSL